MKLELYLEYYALSHTPRWKSRLSISAMRDKRKNRKRLADTKCQQENIVKYPFDYVLEARRARNENNCTKLSAKTASSWIINKFCPLHYQSIFFNFSPSCSFVKWFCKTIITILLIDTCPIISCCPPSQPAHFPPASHRQINNYSNMQIFHMLRAM